jgi:chromosome segregation ATPase
MTEGGSNMSANQPPVQSPESTLNKLKTDLDNKKRAADDTAREIAELNESITGFEPIIREIKQVASSYSQALKNLKCERDDLQSFLTEKGNKIKNEVTHEAQKQIEEKVNEFDEWLSNSEASLSKNHSDTYNEYINAKNLYDEKQKVYTDLKNYQKDIDDQVKETKSIREGVEKEYNKDHVGNAFFLVNEMEASLGKVHIKTPEQFESELNDASLYLYNAKEDLKKKTKIWEAVDKQFKEEMKGLELHKRNRREEILNKIGSISAGSAPSGRS